MQMISVGIGIEFFLLGACLILWGLRRNKQQVTLCAQCKGRFDDQHDVTTTCPHCQHDLRLPDARLMQQKKVLSVQMIFGMIGLAVCLVWFFVQPVIRMELSKIIGLELAAFGMLGVLWALWGKHARQHYFCSRCEYDLTGVAYKISACPECGCNLSHEKAVCHTSKKIRFRDMFIAFAMLGLGIVFLRVDLVNKFNELEWIEYKLDAWVVADAIKEMDADLDLDDHDNFDELVSRINDDKLSDVQKQRIAQRLIDQNENLYDHFLIQIWDICYKQKCLTEEQVLAIVEIMERTPPFSGAISNWRVGVRFPIVIASSNAVFHHEWFKLKDIHIEVFLDGQLIESYTSDMQCESWPLISSSTKLDASLWSEKSGQELDMTIACSGTIARAKIPSMVNTTITTKQTQKVHLAAKDEQTSLFVEDPQIESAMDKSWVDSLVRADADGTDVWLAFNDMSMPIAMSLWASYAEHEVRLGHVRCFYQYKYDTPHWYCVSGPALPGQPASVKLELRADPAAALWQSRNTTFWQGDLIRDDVPVNPKIDEPYRLSDDDMQSHREQILTDVYRDQNGDVHLTSKKGAFRLFKQHQIRLKHQGQWIDVFNHPQWQASLFYNWKGSDRVLFKGLPADIEKLEFSVNANSYSYRTAPWGYMLQFDPIPIGTPDKPNTQEYIGQVKYLDVGY